MMFDNWKIESAIRGYKIDQNICTDFLEIKVALSRKNSRKPRQNPNPTLSKFTGKCRAGWLAGWLADWFACWLACWPLAT